MQFAESRKDLRDEILAIFRVPKPVLGIFEDINLASAQVADLVFAKYTVKPKMRFFVDKLSWRGVERREPCCRSGVHG
jgi:hypothetical protein